MVEQRQLALSDAAEWLGDWHPLAEQLGSSDGLVTLASVSALLRLRPVRGVPSLRQFLRHYQSQILVPLELPAIQSACEHASRHEVRELAGEIDKRMREIATAANTADSLKVAILTALHLAHEYRQLRDKCNEKTEAWSRALEQVLKK